jgi:SAM-dependent methyltransferase
MTDIKAMMDQIGTLSAGFVHAQILFTANAANLFADLEESSTAEEIARKQEWSVRGTSMLLDGLVALELLEKDQGNYSNSETASQCLVPDKENYQGDIIRHNQNGYLAWAELGEAIHLGTCPEREQQERSSEELRNFILGMSNIGITSARQMLGVLDLTRYRHLLDVGGGPATYGIEFVKACPGLQATLFDLPDVVEIAKEQVKDAEFEARFNYISGDLTTDNLGEGYDLVLLSNIVHMLGMEENVALIQKCYDALIPGGTLILKDFFVEDDRSGSPFGLIFALRMLLFTEKGGTYSLAEVQHWTDTAGFEAGRLEDLTPQTRLWIANKPA